MSEVAEVEAQEGNLDRAKILAEETASIGKSIDDGLGKAHAQVAVARAVASTLDLDRAVVIAGSITEPEQRILALCTVARIARRMGEDDRARFLVEHAAGLSRSTMESRQQARALQAVAGAMASISELDRATSIAELILEAGEQAKALCDMAMSSEPSRARRLVARAIRIGGWRHCATALAIVESGAIAEVAAQLFVVLGLNIPAGAAEG